MSKSNFELAEERTERILFVDDEPQVAIFAQKSLGRLGYRVVTFTSSLDALDEFRASPDAYV